MRKKLILISPIFAIFLIAASEAAVLFTDSFNQKLNWIFYTNDDNKKGI